MAFSPQALLAEIEHDLSAAKGIYDRAQDAAMALEQVSCSDVLGSGQAATAFRDLMREIRLPAVYLIQDIVMEYVEDIRANRAAAEDAFRFSGAVVDLEQMRSLAGFCDGRIGECQRIKGQSGLSAKVTRAADVTLYHLVQLRTQLHREIDTVEAYLNDSSLYARSQVNVARLSSIEACMRSVSYDARTGACNLDGIDLSWRPPLDDAWWRQHNRRILEHYFQFDEKGSVIGVKADAMPRLMELGTLVPECLFGSGLPDKVDSLTGAEKYILLTFIYSLAPNVYNIEKGVADWLISAQVAADRILQQLPWYEELKGIAQDLYNGLPRIDLMKGLTSFSFEGGRFMTSDSPGSIQHKNGYADAFDEGALLLGMDLDTHVTTFEHGGREYRIQEWDGSYTAGIGYGGEVGVYSRDISPDGHRGYHHLSRGQVAGRLDCLTSQEVESQFIMYRAVEGDQVPEMQVVVHSTDPIADYKYRITGTEGSTSWSFNGMVRPLDKYGKPLPSLSNDNLYVTTTMDFKNDPDFAKAAYEALRGDGIDARLEGTEVAVSYGAEGRD